MAKFSITVCATHHPKFDPFCPFVHARRDSFIGKYIHNKQLSDKEIRSIQRAYREARSKMGFRIITAIPLAAAGSQQDVADDIDMDRSVLSIMLNYGQGGSSSFGNFFFDPYVLGQFTKNVQFRNLMSRAGFVAALQFVAKLCDWPVPQDCNMNDVSYEFLASHVACCHGKDPGQPADAESVAVAVALLGSMKPNIVPGWFVKSDREGAATLLGQLRDPAFAMKYLHDLQHHWMDFLIFVWSIVEGECDDDLWQAS